MDSKELLNLRVQKRINNDLSEMGKNMKELNDNGIFWHVNEDNIREIFIVIFGQEDTPYANAPFLFKFRYPDNYPLIPPEGKFCTSDGETRFNPNLYVEGKICLSILGTWSGPSWTPVMSIKTIIMSIIALVMTNEPLKNEPGWETARKEDIEDYNNVVEYKSLKTGIIQQLTHKQECFLPLYEHIIPRIGRDFPKIMERIDKNMDRLKGVKLIRPRYGPASNIDYASLKKDMIELGKKYGILQESNPPLPLATPPSTTSVEQIIPAKNPAANYELGLEVEYKGIKYKVCAFTNGRKYWKKN